MLDLGSFAFLTTHYGFDQEIVRNIPVDLGAKAERPAGNVFPVRIYETMTTHFDVYTFIPNLIGFPI